MLSISLSVNQDSFEHALEGEFYNEKNPINQTNNRKQGHVLNILILVLPKDKP